MQNKKMRQNVGLLAFVCGSAFMQAQATLYVKEKTGTQSAYSLSSIRNLTFPAGNVQVIQNSGNSASYGLSTVRYLNFKDIRAGITPIGTPVSSTLLYPNPATDQIQISFESPGTEKIQVEIVDIQGRVLQQQIISSQTGTNHMTIPVSHLSQGIYFCHLQSGAKTENIKFVKN